MHRIVASGNNDCVIVAGSRYAWFTWSRRGIYWDSVDVWKIVRPHSHSNGPYSCINSANSNCSLLPVSELWCKVLSHFLYVMTNAFATSNLCKVCISANMQSWMRIFSVLSYNKIMNVDILCLAHWRHERGLWQNRVSRNADFSGWVKLTSSWFRETTVFGNVYKRRHSYMH